MVVRSRRKSLHVIKFPPVSRGETDSAGTCTTESLHDRHPLIAVIVFLTRCPFQWGLGLQLRIE
jgi:hypothetical protein